MVNVSEYAQLYHCTNQRTNKRSCAHACVPMWIDWGPCSGHWPLHCGSAQCTNNVYLYSYTHTTHIQRLKITGQMAETKDNDLYSSKKKSYGVAQSNFSNCNFVYEYSWTICPQPHTALLSNENRKYSVDFVRKLLVERSLFCVFFCFYLFLVCKLQVKMVLLSSFPSDFGFIFMAFLLLGKRTVPRVFVGIHLYVRSNFSTFHFLIADFRPKTKKNKLIAECDLLRNH